MSEWKKSSYSGSESSCVEVKMTGRSVLVRDTKNRDGGTLEFTDHEWRCFIAGAKDGEFGDGIE